MVYGKFQIRFLIKQSNLIMHVKKQVNKIFGKGRNYSMIRNIHTFIMLTAACVLIGAPCGAQESSQDDVFEKSNIISIMHRVNDNQLKKTRGQTDRNWKRATYYTGVMAFYRATHDQKLLDQAIAWGDKHKWQVGTEGSGANKLTCCQTWLDLYMVFKKPEMLAPTVAWANSTEFPAPGFDGAWYTHTPRGKGHRYADSLYVGPPALVKLY
jgi:rhamnogalacturonyl hydrolase YesR